MLHLGKRSERVKSLRRRVRRRVAGEVVVDGFRLVDDLIRWNIPIRELYLAVSIAEARAEEIVEMVAAAAEVYLLDDGVMAQIAPTRSPQGVLAVVDEPPAMAWNGAEGTALWLDGVQDPGNLGAIVRVAAGLGAEAVLCGPGCADPFGPAAVRGSAGAVFKVPVESGVGISRAVDLIRKNRGEIWATAASGTRLDSWRPARPLLLMLGAEGRGLSSEAFAAADGVISIDLARGVESLNVAVAAGIVLSFARN